VGLTFWEGMIGRRVQSCLLIDACVTCAMLYFEGIYKGGRVEGRQSDNFGPY